ncbi:MAG: recombination-associated protein RdgC [Gammaproteobacteria bacterium]|nr:recombination-associated protein RdgC [Gammaproteobacteria bacterium]
MWFKNLRIYRLSEALPCPIGELGEKLLESAFRPCSGMESSRMGWVPPMGPNTAQLVHTIAIFTCCAPVPSNGCCRPRRYARCWTRKSSIENRGGANSDAANVPTLEGGDPDPAAAGADPLAPPTGAFLAARRGLLLMDSALPASAEDLLNLLRDSLGRLPVKPLVPRTARST